LKEIDVKRHGVFSALAKYNSARHENYLTESLVFVLKAMLVTDPDASVRFLNKLCFGEGDAGFTSSSDISISTQVSTDEGKPDITVSAPTVSVFVEVKHDSPLGYRQMERYRKALLDRTATTKRLVLLTRFAIDFGEAGDRPDMHIRWSQIDDWLRDAKVTHPVTIYLVAALREFLKEKNMSIDKTTSEYVEGTTSLFRFMDMLRAAIESEGLKIYQNSAGWTHRGYYIEDNRKFCGILYADPRELLFQLDNDNVRQLTLEDSPGGFFAVERDAQVEILRRFVRDGLAAAKTQQ